MSNKNSKFLKLIREYKGSVTLEFAIIFPVFAMLLVLTLGLATIVAKKSALFWAATTVSMGVSKNISITPELFRSHLLTAVNTRRVTLIAPQNLQVFYHSFEGNEGIIAFRVVWDFGDNLFPTFDFVDSLYSSEELVVYFRQTQGANGD